MELQGLAVHAGVEVVLQLEYVVSWVTQTVAMETKTGRKQTTVHSYAKFFSLTWTSFLPSLLSLPPFSYPPPIPLCWWCVGGYGSPSLTVSCPRPQHWCRGLSPSTSELALVSGQPSSPPLPGRPAMRYNAIFLQVLMCEIFCRLTQKFYAQTKRLPCSLLNSILFLLMTIHVC